MPAPTRASLLWPGRPRLALARWDPWALAAAYLVALAVRWTILDAGPYTAEAAHYAMARNLWRGVDNLDSLFEDVVPDDFAWFFWQRPLLCLVFWPGASLGFTAFRVEHVLLSSLVPVLAATLLRQLGTRPAWAYAAALALAVHPVLVPWSVLVLPDSLVAAFALAGLLAAHDGRPFATAAFLLAGAWVKEVGAVTAAALFLLACWRDADGSRASLWPLRLGPFATPLLAAGLLAAVPLAVSLQLPYGTVPGFRVGGDLAVDLERLFLLVWLAPVALLGLALPATRRLAAVALAWPAFFVAYHLGTGKAIEVWYHVVPATLVACAAAATLSHLAPAARGAAARPATPAARAARWSPVALAILLAGLLAVQVAVPQAHPLQRAAVTPLTGQGQWSLEEALRYEEVRGDDLDHVLAAVPASRRGTWTALDMDYSLVMHPLASLAGRVNKDFTPAGDLDDATVRWWADAVERRADATFLAVHPEATELNQAIREAYAPCLTAQGGMAVVQPQACQGYGDRLVASYRRIHGAELRPT